MFCTDNCTEVNKEYKPSGKEITKCCVCGRECDCGFCMFTPFNESYKTHILSPDTEEAQLYYATMEWRCRKC